MSLSSTYPPLVNVAFIGPMPDAPVASRPEPSPMFGCARWIMAFIGGALGVLVLGAVAGTCASA